jgi:hypothetical protein
VLDDLRELGIVDDPLSRAWKRSGKAGKGGEAG